MALQVLQNLRVLDFTRVLSGPYCTAMLGDLGAEVVKIEAPGGGDPSRGFVPPELGGESTYFLQMNRNKKSVVLDLSSELGRRAALALAVDADVVVENFRAGVLDRMGLGYEQVNARNPGVVYCSITGYGSSGPLADRAGLDPVIQAESGLMAMTGEPDGAPMRIGISLVDAVSGMYAAHCIMAALMHRSESGVGQRVEVSLFDTAVNMLVNFGASYLMSGEAPGRPGNSNLVAQPSGLYEAADGPVVLTCVGDAVFERLCIRGLNAPELARDARFKTNADRLENVTALTDALNTLLRTQPRQHWIERLRAIGVPAGEVRTVPQALQSYEFEQAGLVDTVMHPSAGAVPLMRSPARLSRTPVRAPEPAPRLGEDSEDILRELDFDAAELDELLTTAGLR